MRIAIYYRVSTDRQDLDSQRSEVETWLKGQRNVESVTVYKDEGRSGKDISRPGFQSMLTSAHAGEVDTIVVYKLDRFSRDATTALRLLLELDSRGVAFISVTQPVLNLGHDNPFRRTMLAAFAEIAQIERETIVARVRSGLQAAKARGVRLGQPPKVNAILAANARRMAAAGSSYREISKALEVSLGTVHKLLHGFSSEPEESQHGNG